MKIVINTCFGGFSLSATAKDYYDQLTNTDVVYWDIERNDPTLVHVVEELGTASWGTYAQLKVVDIPDDVEDWEITYYDGLETIRETSRTWS